MNDPSELCFKFKMDQSLKDFRIIYHVQNGCWIRTVQNQPVVNWKCVDDLLAMLWNYEVAAEIGIYTKMVSATVLTDKPTQI